MDILNLMKSFLIQIVYTIGGLLCTLYCKLYTIVRPTVKTLKSVMLAIMLVANWMNA